MFTSLYTTGLTVAAVGAAARGTVVVLGFVRTFLLRKQFVTFQFGWTEALVSLEPLLLLVVAFGLFQSVEPGIPPTFDQTIAALLGGGLVLAGWTLVAWTFISWPAIFSGHGVLQGQQLRTRGAYGLVRHPVYSGAVLVWLGLAVAFAHAATLALAILYVVPTYLAYLRAEETMMLASFGDQYRSYQRRVPQLIPRLYRKRRAPS